MDDWCGRVIIYDSPDGPAGDRAGVVVDPRCPKCRRLCASAETSVVYDGWNEGVAHFEGWTCRRCGPFQPDVICWAGDLLSAEKISDEDKRKHTNS
jgi:hypothetical protein